MHVMGIGKTDKGAQRKWNEDFILSDPGLGLHIVCDGMGGEAAGGVASELAAKTVHQAVAQQRATIDAVNAGQVAPEKLVQVLRAAIEKACEVVHDTGQADITKRGMGTTCVSLLIGGGKAVMGHVGDSRCYLARGGQVTQLSEDHTFVAEAIKQGVFSPDEAEEFAFRNVITRCIGKERSVLVDTLIFDMCLGDTLLLCSDGLYQYTKDARELAHLLTNGNAAELPKQLIDLANSRGGSDNISTIIVRADPGVADAESAQRSQEALANLGTLQKIELLKDLSTQELMKISQIFQEVRYPAGTVIIREGEVSDLLFVLVQGKGEVVRGDFRVALLPAGAHVGEMSLLNNRPRSATVRTVEPSRVLCVDRARLYGFLQQDGMLAAKVFWKLAETLSRRLDELLQQQEQERTQFAQAGHLSGMYQRPNFGGQGR